MREKKLSDYLVSALSISFHFSSMLAAPLVEHRSAMTQLHRHRDPFQQRSNKGVDLLNTKFESLGFSRQSLYHHCFPLVLAMFIQCIGNIKGKCKKIHFSRSLLLGLVCHAFEFLHVSLISEVPLNHLSFSFLQP